MIVVSAGIRSAPVFEMVPPRCWLRHDDDCGERRPTAPLFLNWCRRDAGCAMKMTLPRDNSGAAMTLQEQ
eukprot:365383-Chlamydomonas_euryale.AAC.10